MMKESMRKSKIIKAQPTQEKVLKLLVYLLEANGPVSMISLEKLYGGGEHVDQDKRRTIFRHLDIIENKWGIELIRGDHYSIKKKNAFQSVELNSMEAQALYFSAGDITDPDLRLMTQAKLLRIYQERRKKEDLIPKPTLDLMDWCMAHITHAKIKMQMRLIAYRSINSGMIADRIVVPIAFNLENLEIYAIDLADGNVLKVFKLDRMDGIEKLKEKAPKELKLDKFEIKRDPFGYLINEHELTYVDMRMDLKAFLLFSLHFSKLVPFVQKLAEEVHPKPYRLELHLVKVDPLAGWILGLLQHVDWVDSPMFNAELLRFYQNQVASVIESKLNISKR